MSSDKQKQKIKFRYGRPVPQKTITEIDRVEKRWKYDKNTKTFKCKEIDVQSEINKFNGLDYKSLILNNQQYKVDDNGAFYADIRPFQELTACDAITALNDPNAIEQKISELEKQLEQVEKINNENVENISDVQEKKSEQNTSK